MCDLDANARWSNHHPPPRTPPHTHTHNRGNQEIAKVKAERWQGEEAFIKKDLDTRTTETKRCSQVRNLLGAGGGVHVGSARHLYVMSFYFAMSSNQNLLESSRSYYFFTREWNVNCNLSCVQTGAKKLRFNSKYCWKLIFCRRTALSILTTYSKDIGLKTSPGILFTKEYWKTVGVKAKLWSSNPKHKVIESQKRISSITCYDSLVRSQCT